MAAWFDRDASRSEFLSLHLTGAYLPSYFADAASGFGKIGTAALFTILAQAQLAFNEMYFAVIMFWMGDMALGTLRALRDPNVSFRWSKLGDGFLRLLVILVLPPLVAITEVLPQLAGWDTNQSITYFVLGIIGLQEILSILEHAEFFYPRLSKLRQMAIKRFGGEEPKRRVNDT